MSRFRIGDSGASLTAKDFWSLVDLFGNLDKTMAFAGEVRDGLDQISAQTKANQAESKRLVDLAIDLEAKRHAIEAADEELLGIRKKFEADKAVAEAAIAAAKEANEADRAANVRKESELTAKERKLSEREAALIEVDRVSQESADRRTKELDAREQAIAEGEAALEAKKAKLAAALGD